MRGGLRSIHQPRPWSCSPREARWCTHHGDCTCLSARLDGPRCPLHGPNSDHPWPEPRMAEAPAA